MIIMKIKTKKKFQSLSFNGRVIKMVFTKKVIRDFRKKIVRYLLIMIVIVLGIGVSVAYTNVYESVKKTVTDNWEDCNVEDGEFMVYLPLSDEQEKGFTDKGADLEKKYYIDSEAENDLTVRLFGPRKTIDILNLYAGRLPEKDNDLVLDRVFASDNKIKVGDHLSVNKKEYTVCGFVTAVDYLQRIRNLSDAGTTSSFGIGFVTEDEFDSIAENNRADIVYNYSYVLRGAENSELKDYLFSLDKIVTPYDSYDILYSFTEKDNNSRIVYGYKSVESEKTIGIIAAVVLGALISYIISVFAVSEINEESGSIGLLFAMGYEKHQIAMQYVKLPVFIVALGSAAGCLAGKFLTGFLISSTYSYPEIHITFPPYMLLFGIAVPVVLAFIINYCVASSHLNATPLSLMRNEKKSRSAGNSEVKIKNFITSFRVHHILNEKKAYAVTALGIILSILVMMIGIAMDSTISNFADEAKADVKYNNMYMFSTQPENIPEDAEKSITRSYSLLYETTNTYFTVMVSGIVPDSRYFDFADQTKDLGTDEVLVSSAVAEKFGYDNGDTIVLKDLLHEEDYSFKIKKTADYSYGFSVFMNIDSMRKYYDMGEDYFNTVYSGEPVETGDTGIVYESTREGVENTVDNWIKLGRSEFIMFSVISVIIFVIVTFLLIKAMIERSSFDISMLKIMGYGNRDVSKIYLDHNILTVIASSAVGIPLSVAVIGKLVNMMTAAMKCYMPAYIGTKQIIISAAVILVSYFISTFIVKRHINRISFAEVLKNRE